MGILALSADERVRDVRVSEKTVDGQFERRSAVSVTLVWYPRLFSGTPKQRSNRKVCAAGYGIHSPPVDKESWRRGFIARCASAARLRHVA